MQTREAKGGRQNLGRQDKNHGHEYSCLPMVIYRENLNVEREFNQISVRYNNLVSQSYVYQIK